MALQRPYINRDNKLRLFDETASDRLDFAWLDNLPTTLAGHNITLVAGDIPNLDAAKITSGTFADARIPSLAASKITSGTFADARIAQSNVTQHQAALTLTSGQVTAALAYTPVNRAGDTFTGVVTFESQIRGGGAASTLDILQPTTDGADSGAIRIFNRANTNTGGARAIFAGNEYSGTPGLLGLFSGLNADVQIVGSGSGNILLQSTSGTAQFNGNVLWHGGNLVSPASLAASVNTFTGRQLVNLNVAAISNTAYADGHLELRTTDSSLPRIGFHRSGVDALALYYNGLSELRVRRSNGNDYALWHEGNILNIGTTAGTARTALSLGTSATVNTGTSGATIPLLNGNNTFSGTATFSNAAGINVSAGPVLDSIGNVRRIPPVLRNSTTAFTAADIGKVIYKSNTTAYTWTLYNGTAGDAITIKNAGASGNVTIARGGFSLVDDSGTDADFTLVAGQSRLLLCISAGNWWVL
jgi:hypothetical protein